MIDFAELPLWANFALLAAGSAAVWMAGTRHAVDAEALTRKTQITEASGGLLLLAFATSPPEVVTSFAASISGQRQSRIQQLIGGVAMQTGVLSGPDLLMQAGLLILLLAIVIAGPSAGGAASVFGVGLATVGLAVAYVAGLFILRRYKRHPGWRAVDPPERRTLSAALI